MAISQLFFLSLRGDTIIFRDFRRDINKKINEVFFRQVNLPQNETPPIFNCEGVNFVYVKKSDIYIVLATLDNISPCYYLEILYKLQKVIKDECGVLNEESIRKNFVLVYEIINEMFDFGYPQLCSTEDIKTFVFTEPVMMMNISVMAPINNFINRGVKNSEYVKKPISQVVEKKRNELFIDLIEKLTVLFNSKGNLVNLAISGCIKMKSYLKNNPELKITLSDDIRIANSQSNYMNSSIPTMSEYNFHPKVKYKDFENSKIIYLTPPDGEFILMNYSMSNDFNPPFRIYPTIIDDNYKIELKINLQSTFDKNTFAGNVTIKFNVPKNTNNVHFQLEKDAKILDKLNPVIQKTDYIQGEKMCYWKIGKIQGGQSKDLITKITLLDNNITKARRELGPITISFDIPNFNYSKVQIKECAILTNDKKYNPMKWLRVLTQAYSYVIRIN
jgi:AP-4 complex subunit mu-1